MQIQTDLCADLVHAYRRFDVAYLSEDAQEMDLAAEEAAAARARLCDWVWESMDQQRREQVAEKVCKLRNGIPF